MLASVKALLSASVDYAGLFPPAKLGMWEAMVNYTQDQKTPYSWLLGRFVLPASRLTELAALLPKFSLAESQIMERSLSAIVSGNLQLEIEQVRWRSMRLHNDNIAIKALEFPPLPPTEINRLLPHLPTGVDAFFEIPLNGDLETYLAALQGTGAFAKVRTGGITTNAFPSPTQLGQFIFACAKAHVPFKATAGLHHPLPGSYRVTYEPDSPFTVMHGFLNVAISAALVYWQKVTLEEVLKVLQEPVIDSFQFRMDGISWSDRHLSLAEIEAARQNFFLSFGSCSFREPIDDLKDLRLLS